MLSIHAGYPLKAEMSLEHPVLDDSNQHKTNQVALYPLVFTDANEFLLDVETISQLVLSTSRHRSCLS
jgi:hypothetical protein